MSLHLNLYVSLSVSLSLWIPDPSLCFSLSISLSLWIHLSVLSPQISFSLCLNLSLHLSILPSLVTVFRKHYGVVELFLIVLSMSQQLYIFQFIFCISSLAIFCSNLIAVCRILFFKFSVQCVISSIQFSKRHSLWIWLSLLNLPNIITEFFVVLRVINDI